jgi:hypothetical protein
MINEGIDVPEKTIAVFMASPLSNLFKIEKVSDLNEIISKPNKKRDWFDPDFYNCLPLTIGNQYGFIIKAQHDINIIWNGGNAKEDLNVTIINDDFNLLKIVESHFGYGIVTFNLPFILKTPPGINLMTINPPNFIMENITPMTGVVETDNLRYTFTINLKIQQPNVLTHIKKGSPIGAIIPIPRYFADKFELKMANEIFNQEIIDEEIKIYKKGTEIRSSNQLDRNYFKGFDSFKNKFKDHQRG